MTLTLQPELEDWVLQEAQREGVAPEEIVRRVIEAQWAVAQRAPHLSRRESDLLTKINEGFPEQFWQHYRPLRQKLEAETLTETERIEFLRLNQQVEAKNVERMGCLLELANLRGKTLPDMMKQLGIGSIQAPE